MSNVLRVLVRGLALGAIILLSFTFVRSASAQTSRFDVTGMVSDTLGVPLRGATVVVLTRSDSLLTKFATARSDGSFTVRRVVAGDYILQVTFVGYEPFRSNFSLVDSAYDAAEIRLREAVGELGELVVSSEHIPIVIKGDTLEFNAAAFGVRPNAVVEDLLRLLPGIEVEDDGTIIAQGEEVQNILVDGKEFFGSDPTIATRNLPADAIDKVQVYDKLSDMAEFTGVDDGEEQKTINLELKEDYKNGYFGNMSGGYGDDNRYDGQASINRFTSTTQLSFIGNVNNVNRQGFSFGDYINFMGGMGALTGRSFSLGGGGIQLGTDLSDGFSDTVALGLNASRDFGTRLSIRSSYFLSSIENRQNRVTKQQQVLGSDQSSFTDQTSDQGSENLTHRLNANFKYEFKKGHDIQLRSNVRASSSSLSNFGFRETAGRDGFIQNSAQTAYLSDGDNFGGDASLTYRKRLNEKGRSLVAEIRLDLNDSEQTGDLKSTTGFFRPGDIATYEELVQFQSNLGNTLRQTQKLSLSEPLGNGRLIEIRGERRQISEDQDKSVYDTIGSTRIFNDLLSSGLDRTYTYYRAGLNFRKNWESVRLGFGVDVQESTLEGVILDSEISISNGFTHVLPTANLRYEIREGMTVNARYSASTREPTMRELQPFQDNSDPLNVYVGNPSLKPEYRHNATLNYHYFDQFTFVNLFAYINASYVENKIARSRTIDERLTQEITSINTDGVWTFNGSLNFGAPIRPFGMKFSLSNRAMYSKGIEFINSEENESNILRNTLGIKLENRSKDLFDLRVGADFSFNKVDYSLNSSLNQNYVNSTYSVDASYYLGESWEFSTSLDYRVYSKEVFGSADNIPLLRATISKTLANQRADIQIIGLDLLDKNEGINFSNSGNFIQESRVNSLGRYVMLKFVYRLSGSNSRGGGIDIRMDHR